MSDGTSGDENEKGKQIGASDLNVLLCIKCSKNKAGFAYKNINEYEKIIEYGVNEAFKTGWNAARLTSKQLGLKQTKDECYLNHQIAMFVNELRDIAQVMGHTQQLRERIRKCVFKFLDT